MATTPLPTTLSEAHQIIIHRDATIQKLEERVSLLLKLRYAHKSEKWTNKDRLQSLLFDEAEANTTSSTQQEEENPETEEVTYTRKKRAGRKKLDPTLPRAEIIHDLDEAEKTCKCGQTMHQVSQNEREELDMEPARYWVNRHIYPQYACGHCNNQPDETNSEVKGAPNNALIPKSFASPGLLAYLFVSKFEDHLPFYRMERILARLGVELPRATMCNWVIKINEYLEPLLESMKSDLLKSELIAADETTLQVMKEHDRKNTTKSFMWIFRGELADISILLYEYHPTRSGKVPNEFLENYEGFLLTDGYAGYNEVARRPGVTHAGCWAHARRKFKEAHDIMETENTRKILGLIQHLYLIEQNIRVQDLGFDQILSLRQEKSKLIVEELRQYLMNLHVPPESLLSKAVGYTLNQWEKLLVFLDNPIVPIDNNRVENDIRPFVLGRKNWLFSGSPRGARASCMLYSLIQTAKANGLDPYRYLRVLFERLAELNRSDLDSIAELAPHRIDLSVIN